MSHTSSFPLTCTTMWWQMMLHSADTWLAVKFFTYLSTKIFFCFIIFFFATIFLKRIDSKRRNFSLSIYLNDTLNDDDDTQTFLPDFFFTHACSRLLSINFKFSTFSSPQSLFLLMKMTREMKTLRRGLFAQCDGN